MQMLRETVMSARDAKRLIIASILHLEMLAAAEDDDEIRAATLVICARSRSQHTTRAHTLCERALSWSFNEQTAIAAGVIVKLPVMQVPPKANWRRLPNFLCNCVRMHI
jgi:hypothetical protein